MRLSLLNNKLIPRKCWVASAPVSPLTLDRCCCVRVLGWPLSRRNGFPSGRVVFLLLSEHCEFLTSGCSVHEVAWAGGVDLLEGNAGAFVEDALGLEAFVLVVTVGSHASSEGLEVELAELVEDILAG